MMDGFWRGWSVVGFIFMLAIWVAVIAGIVVLVRWLAGSRPGQPSGGEPTATEILKRRYARGEISKAEFEEKKKDLQ